MQARSGNARVKNRYPHIVVSSYSSRQQEYFLIYLSSSHGIAEE